MLNPTPSRRLVLAGLAASATLPATALRAEEVIELSWSDLLPEGEAPLPEEFSGIVQHDMASMMSLQPPASGVRTDWNGKSVSLPGFVVPLQYDGTGVTAFILVPYVGACIHVPPPPPNQLVLVTTEKPYEVAGLFEPVEVFGKIGTTPTTTDLAEIGYVMQADQIRAYG